MNLNALKQEYKKPTLVKSSVRLQAATADTLPTGPRGES
jgi:hypothetical protein